MTVFFRPILPSPANPSILFTEPDHSPPRHRDHREKTLTFFPNCTYIHRRVLSASVAPPSRRANWLRLARLGDQIGFVCHSWLPLPPNLQSAIPNPTNWVRLARPVRLFTTATPRPQSLLSNLLLELNLHPSRCSPCLGGALFLRADWLCFAFPDVSIIRISKLSRISSFKLRISRPARARANWLCLTFRVSASPGIHRPESPISNPQWRASRHPESPIACLTSIRCSSLPFKRAHRCFINTTRHPARQEKPPPQACQLPSTWRDLQSRSQPALAAEEPHRWSLPRNALRPLTSCRYSVKIPLQT